MGNKYNDPRHIDIKRSDEIEYRLGLTKLEKIFKIQVGGSLNLDLAKFDMVKDWDTLLYDLMRLIANVSKLGYDPKSDNPDARFMDILDIHIESRSVDVSCSKLWIATNEAVVITRGKDRVVIAEVHEVRNVDDFLLDFIECNKTPAVPIRSAVRRFERQLHLQSYIIGAASSEEAIGLLAILKLAI